MQAATDGPTELTASLEPSRGLTAAEVAGAEAGGQPADLCPSHAHLQELKVSNAAATVAAAGGDVSQCG